MFCMLDYNRAVDNLVANMKELAERNSTRIFYPPAVVGINRDELQAEFKEIGFRYGNRDAKGFQQNSTIVTNEFGGSWQKVHAAAGYDAPTLVKILRDEDFKFIKGKKLAPFYARVVNDYVHPLDNVWQLDIPVDTWIRKLTQELLEQDMTDDEIREHWRQTGTELDISPAIVDGAMWIMGYSWDDWGREYFTELTGRETFKYM